jgi:hypothetical protein
MKKSNRISTAISIVSMATVFLLPISALAAGPAPVDLLSAGNFRILSQTGITNTGSHTSAITGDIGSSPITAAAMNTVFCSEIIGTIYGVDAAYIGSGSQVCFAGNPPLANKTLVDNAVLDMGIAYTDAAGRTLPTATELGAGNIGGMTLAPGLYKWSTDVSIPTNVTLSGDADDVWIFQIEGNLDIASAGSVPAGIKVILGGDAQASNIFWQVGGATGATLGTYSTFNGNILTAKQIIIQTGAILNGKALAQTQVTLDANIISAGPSTISGTIGGSIDGSTDEGTIDGSIDGGSTDEGTIGGSTGGSTTSGTISGGTGSSLSGTVTGGDSGGGGSSGGSVLGASTGGSGSSSGTGSPGEVLGAATFPGFPTTGMGLDHIGGNIISLILLLSSLGIYGFYRLTKNA